MCERDMEKINKGLWLSAEKVAQELKVIGEELTTEEVEKMLESMQLLVTLAINQYFRKSLPDKTTSSTNR